MVSLSDLKDRPQKIKTYQVSRRIFEVTVYGKEIVIDQKNVNLVLSRPIIIEGKFTQTGKYILSLIFSALILKS